MTSLLVEFLKNLNPDTVADTFILFIAALFIVTLYVIYRKKQPHFVDVAPVLLTSLGILGTFVGITIGLANFDPETSQTIDESIPQLLGGLKMAFLTSILGMASSLAAKTFAMWHQSNGEDDEPDEIGAEEIYREIHLQRETLGAISEQINISNKILAATRKSIAGEGDASVVTQIQKMRSDIQDGFKDLQRDFQTFAEKVSEIGTKQLIEALNEVIRDFNKNLTEQFGENFKRLDEPVTKLVVWQEEYREQMEVMKDDFELASQGIDASKAAVESIREEASHIPALMDSLKYVLESATVQLNELEEHLAAFSEIRDKAVEAVPEINQRMNEMTESINGAVNDATNHHKELLTVSAQMIEAYKKSSHELHGKFVDELTEQIDWISTHLKDTSIDIEATNKRASISLKEGAASIQNVSNTFAGEIQKSSESLQGTVDQMSHNLEHQISQVFEGVQRNIQQLSQSLQEANSKAADERSKMLNQELTALDDAMQQEISRTMQEMGTQLTRITGKFVEDYTDLTEHMKQVVERGYET